MTVLYPWPGFNMRVEGSKKNNNKKRNNDEKVQGNLNDILAAIFLAFGAQNFF